jgi:hypothetical protein
MDAKRIAGGCLCGGVRYTSEVEPVLMAVCHCPHCQKQTSSAFSMIVGVPSGTLRFEGRDLAAFEDVGESGQPVTRRFCPGCGSAIVTHVSVAPELEWIKAGTLDDTSWFEPQMHIWCDTAQPWVTIDDSIPSFGKNPTPDG